MKTKTYPKKSPNHPVSPYNLQGGTPPEKMLVGLQSTLNIDITSTKPRAIGLINQLS